MGTQDVQPIQAFRLGQRSLRRQKGYALVSSMIFAVVSLTVTGAFLMRLAVGTKQVSSQEQKDLTLNFTESAINHALDGITRKTFEDPTMTATELLTEFHGSGKDWMGVGYQSDSKMKVTRPTTLPANKQIQKINSSSTFFNSINTNSSHSQNFWNYFKNGGSNNSLLSSLGLSTMNLDALHEQNYSIYHLQQGRQEADLMISVVPVSHSIENETDAKLHTTPVTHPRMQVHPHADIFKIRATAYLPNMMKPIETRSVDLIVRRPVKDNVVQDKTYDFKFAIHSEGTIEMQNKITDSADGVDADGKINASQEGDIHSNKSITFGPNGKVNGKVTSAGSITLADINTAGIGSEVPSSTYVPNDPNDPRTHTNQVSNKDGTKSYVDEVPIPEFDYSDMVEKTTNTNGTTQYDNKMATECNLTPNASGVIAIGGCYVNGNISLKGGDKLVFTGDVYINGSLSQGGNSAMSVGGTPAPSVSPRIIVKNNITISGNTSTLNNTIEGLFIAMTGNIDVGGNPGTTGEHGSVFVTENPASEAKFHGNQGFFGALVAHGTVIGKGSTNENQQEDGKGIIRDANMQSLQRHVKPSFKPLTANEFYPRVISWKEN